MAELVASDLERLVYEWLTKRGIEFSFQSSLLGGRMEYGGIIIDFILIESGIALRVQGEYFHSGVEQEAKDREARIVLENMGFRVVDLEEQDLITNLDAVMERAIEGNEMSPIYSDLHTGNIGMARGMDVGLGDPTANIPSSITTPEVRTDAASDTNVLNGTLKYDGGMYCDCSFVYGEGKEETSELSWIFPFTFNALYDLFNPQISKTLGLCDDFSKETAPTKAQLTDDTFTSTLGNLTKGQVYSFKAKAKNDSYTDTANAHLLVGV